MARTEVGDRARVKRGHNIYTRQAAEIRPSLDVREIAGKDGCVIVGVSGGKDSLATLDIVMRAGVRKVMGYFLYVVQGLSFEQRWLNYARGRWGIDIIEFPHPDAVRAMKLGTWGKPFTAFEDRPLLTNADVENTIRQLAGEPDAWIAQGHRTYESITRTVWLGKCRGVMADSRRMYPIWRWYRNQVLIYLRLRRIVTPTVLKHSATGFGLTRDSILDIHDRFPADYELVRRAFPMVEAVVARREFQRRRAKGKRGK